MSRGNGSPRVSIPVWPTHEDDLYGPAATVPWSRMLSASMLLAPTVSGVLTGSLGFLPMLDADRTTLELDLRPDALFADSQPITADDVLASLNLAWGIGLRDDDDWRWRNVTDIRLSESGSVLITLSEPDAAIPALLASWRVPILPANWITAVEGSGSPGPPPASGCFQLLAATSNDIEYTRNDGFFQLGRPRLAGVTCIAPTNALSRSTALVTGDVDLLIDAPLLEVPTLRENPEISLVGGPANGLTMVQVNLVGPELQDRRLRVLFAAAISRAPLLDAAVAGEGRPATTLIPADSWAGLELPEETLAPAAVRTGLEELGLLPGIELRLVAPIGDASLANACVQLQEQLAWAGFSLTIDLLTDDEMVRELRSGDWDLVLATMPWWQDPHELIWPLVTSDGPFNQMTYRNPRVDYLASMACRARGIEERAAHYRSIQEIVANEVPLIPLYFGSYFDAMTTAIRNYPVYAPESAAALAQATFDPTSTSAHGYTLAGD